MSVTGVIQDEHRCQINTNSIITTAEVSKGRRGLGGVEEEQFFQESKRTACPSQAAELGHWESEMTGLACESTGLVWMALESHMLNCRVALGKRVHNDSPQGLGRDAGRKINRQPPLPSPPNIHLATHPGEVT